MQLGQQWEHEPNSIEENMNYKCSKCRKIPENGLTDLDDFLYLYKLFACGIWVGLYSQFENPRQLIEITVSRFDGLIFETTERITICGYVTLIKIWQARQKL